MGSLRVGRTLSLLLLICTAIVVAPRIARAQSAEAPPAYVAAIEGSATIDRQGDSFPAAVNMPLVAGDRVRTDRGRVEIRFPDGSGIELAEDSEIEMLSETRVRLLAGVTDRLSPQPVDPRSAQYLPPNLQTYGTTFDQNGSWAYEPQYGNVWYPRVAADWRPYYDGYWDSVPVYGWTWIGAGRWAWPTHHYGRWGYARRGWFWIPGPAFAAAWVSWGVADSYVSWCPLGFDNRPVFALSIGFGDGWGRGWTVVRRDTFGFRGRYVNQFALRARDIPRYTTFRAERSAPFAGRYSGYARGSAGVRGGYAQRSYGTAAPRYGSRADIAPRYSAPRGAAPRYSTPRYESPRGQAPQYQAPRPATPRYEAPRTQGPRYEAPRSQAPRYEAPRSAPQVMPRYNAPRYESPRPAPQQSPRYQGPRYEAPRAAPRAEPRAQPRSERSGPPASRDGGRSGGGERSSGRRRG